MINKALKTIKKIPGVIITLREKIGNKSNKPTNIFDDDLYSNQCNIDISTNNYISNCDHLKRIAIGLQYHYLLSQQKISNDQFVKFCQKTYKKLLDDHCHFIKYHHYHLDEIQKELELEYLIPQCDIINCEVMTRHYRESKDIEDEDNDLNYTFYADCFDRIHHQIHHITRLGLRLKAQRDHDVSRDKQGITKINNDESSNLINFNNMSEMSQIISQRSNEYGLHRFRRYKNTKFNLGLSEPQISSAKKSSPDSTFKNIIDVGEYVRIQLYQMDISISQLPTTRHTLIDLMLNEKYDKWSNECNNLIQILKSEDYDTDSIIMDLDDLIIDDKLNQRGPNSTPCNLHQLFENTMYILHLKNFINNFNGLFRILFNTIIV